MSHFLLQEQIILLQELPGLMTSNAQLQFVVRRDSFIRFPPRKLRSALDGKIGSASNLNQAEIQSRRREST